MDYAQLIAKQKAFYATGKTRDVGFRIESLKRLKASVLKNYDKVVEALWGDFRKSEFDGIATELMCVVDELNVAIKHLRSWARPRRVGSPLVLFKSSSTIHYDPYGCVLVIGAWNYPINLSLIPAIDAIAAGNCCIIKPSELSPRSSAAIAQIIGECFDEEFCAVCEGGAEETSQLLAEELDFIFYTGGARVGKIVAEAAARHLTPIVLELGGKSPCIVDKTANLEVAARRICWGKFINAGQTCVAPDYLFVHRSVKDKLLALMEKTLVEFYGEDPMRTPDYCRIINERHFDRLLPLLGDGRIVCGGASNRSERYIAPTIIELATMDCPIMKDEIFGPLLPVAVYDDISEVISYISNEHQNPLALYLFANDRKLEKYVVNSVSFGGGCINTTLMHIANINLPFGGIGNSGMGNYHGKHGFETFSHKKGIVKRATIFDIPIIYPPFRNRAKLLKRFTLR